LIAGAHAEAIAEFLRCQPVVKLRRGWILLIGQETIQRGLLLG